MRHVHVTALVATALAALGSTGCKNVNCGTGTIERGGSCVPADQTTGTAACGPNTVLEGTQCVPTLPPTTCGSDTTPVIDPATGITTCVGTGGGGCSAPLACPTPTGSGASTTQTICGQIYNFEDNTLFAEANATGSACTTATTTGPCSLGIQAYDALAFATDPQTATPLAIGGEYIDDCGRFRLDNVAQPSAGHPLIALGLDDANPADAGPPGTTNAVGIALPVAPGSAISGVEDWIVAASTTTSWESSGGPSIATGMFAMVFRANCVGTGCDGDAFAVQGGVEMRENGNPVAAGHAFYFTPGDSGRTTIAAAATTTGANGTGLIDNASLADGLTAFTGLGGLTDPTDCTWPNTPGASLPPIVFIQLFRPISQSQKTCTE
jgi:hypothetical protein